MDYEEYQAGDLVDGSIVIKGFKEGGVGRLYMGFCNNRRIKVCVKTLRGDIWERYQLAERWREVSGQLIAAQLPSREIDLGEYLLFSFFREARLVCQAMGHPNVIRGTRLWWNPIGQPFYECDYIENAKDLRQLLREASPEQRLSVLQTLHLALSICNGMSYVSQEMLANYNRNHPHDPATFFVHRDLKPENILLDQRNNVKVVDLGLAKFILGKTTSFFVKMPLFGGSLLYMAPEQAQNMEAVLPSSDIYSVGVTLLELLAGEEAPGKIMSGVACNELGAPQVPGEFMRILQKCVRSRMEQRYQSFKELKRDLIALAQEVAKGEIPIKENLRCASCGFIASQPGRRPPAMAAGAVPPPNGHRMVRVPAGPFVKGFTPAQERKIKGRLGSSGRMKFEKEQRGRTAAFEIDLYPVTNRQYLRFVRESGHAPPPGWRKSGAGDEPFAPGLAEHPVVDVSHEDAQAYCAWAGLKLPTGDQWEKAARGEEGRLYPWGEEYRSSHCHSSESGKKGTVAVTACPEGDSPYGCRQMVGNVFEWVEESHPQNPDFMYLRGGCWSVSCEFLGIPAFHYLASQKKSTGVSAQSGIFGFRCVREPALDPVHISLDLSADNPPCPLCGGEMIFFSHRELRVPEKNIYSWVGFFDID